VGEGNLKSDCAAWQQWRIENSKIYAFLEFLANLAPVISLIKMILIFKDTNTSKSFELVESQL
jgi:hypothetical protein